MKIKLILNFIFLITFYLNSFEKHLKPLDKLGARLNQIENIDLIYVINLDRKADRWEKCINELKPYNIEPFRVPACDGKDLTLEMIYSLFPVLNKDEINKFQPWIYITEKRKIVEYKNKDFWKCIKNYKIKNFSKIRPAGHVGCAYSHLTILKDALDSDYQNILILEDDFVIVKDPHLLGDLVNEADLEIGAGNWDIIYLDNWHEGLKRGKFHFWMRSYPYPHFQSQDPKKFEERQSTSKNIDRIFARHATHSMILSKNGIKKIYSHFLEYKFFYPIDVDLFNIPGINIFQSKNDYITTDALTSDTANTH